MIAFPRGAFGVAANGACLAFFVSAKWIAAINATHCSRLAVFDNALGASRNVVADCTFSCARQAQEVDGFTECLRHVSGMKSCNWFGALCVLALRDSTDATGLAYWVAARWIGTIDAMHFLGVAVLNHPFGEMSHSHRFFFSTKCAY